MIGFNNILDFANAGVIERFHKLVVSPDLLGLGGGTRALKALLVVSFVSALEKHGNILLS